MTTHEEWWAESDGWTLPPCGHLECAQREPACNGPAPDVWDNLPPHLQEALRRALEGLSEAFEDQHHPISPAMQAMWDAMDEIEAYALAREQETFGLRE